MYTKTFLVTLLASLSLVSAAPQAASATVDSTPAATTSSSTTATGNPSVYVQFRVTDFYAAVSEYDPAEVNIGYLTPVNFNASEALLDSEHAVAVNVNEVQCRLYSDDQGVDAYEGPFNVTSPAYLDTNGLVHISAVLCYTIDHYYG